eukprot:m51a1_g8848 putative actin-related protein 4-like (479) ;mRNA; r:478230-479977
MIAVGGEEVGALVIDVGSHSTRAGYAGEDTPKAVFSSCVGVVAAEAAEMEVDAGAAPKRSRISRMRCGDAITPLKTWRAAAGSAKHPHDGMEIVPVLDGPAVRDWDGLERLYQHALVESLRVEPREHPLLVAEPAQASRADRERVAELVLERFEAPAVYLCKSPVLTAFAMGKHTSLVVEVGAAQTVVAPVYEGHMLRRPLVCSPLAGARLTAELQACVAARDVELRPPYTFARKFVPSSAGDEAGALRSAVRPLKMLKGEWQVVHTDASDYAARTESYRAHCVRLVAEDVKHALCRVAPRLQAPGEQQQQQQQGQQGQQQQGAGAAAEAAQAALQGDSAYELADGTVVDLGQDRFRVPELLFNPAPLNAGLKSLNDMVLECLGKCDTDIRQPLSSSIVLAGGSSLLQGLPERLGAELRGTGQLHKSKIVASSHPDERRYSAWIGGSILASLGSFHQLWISRQEFLESGRAIIEKRCP